MVSDENSLEPEVPKSSVEKIDEINVSDIEDTEDMAELISDNETSSMHFGVSKSDLGPKGIPLNSTSVTLWYDRLGHTSTKSEESRLLQDAIFSRDSVISRDFTPCDRGKYRRIFRGSLISASRPWNLHISIQLIGTESETRSVYYMIIVDEHTRLLFCSSIDSQV